MQALSEAVAELKKASRSERTVADRLNEAIAQKDREGCISFFTWKERWSGLGGSLEVRDLMDSAAYVWQNAPEFFVPYDVKRPIDENPSTWTDEYFNHQRGFLRHNFCLERLCHMVMVCEYLRVAGISAPVTTPSAPAPTPSAPAPTPNASAPTSNAPTSTSLKKSLFLILLLGAIGILIIILINFKGGVNYGQLNPEGRETSGDCDSRRDIEGDVSGSVPELSGGTVSDEPDAGSVGEDAEECTP